MNRSRLVCALLAVLSSGCSDPSATSTPITTPAPSSSVPAARTPTPGCVAPAGVSNAPSTIAEAVTLINALPKPLSLGCFLESLARPLQVRASNSLFSAQPADGARSPRIFVFEAAMLMSVVPSGAGAPLLEFGEQRPDYRSVKAELTFPVTSALAASAPFENLMFNDQVTTCAVCHAAEEPDATVSGVRTFSTQSLRPGAGDRVSVASLQHENQICDRSVEPERCALLDGLFGWGTVSDREFPVEMATFGSTQ